MQWPADAVEIVGPALLVLRFLEKWQHRIPVPPLAAALAPIVVIGRRAAHIDHAVDRAGSAKHFAARLIEGAIVELLLGLAFKHPVDARVGERLGVAERDMDPRVAVAPAGLEQKHAPPARLAEPPGNGATRRSRAGHDKVEGFVRSRRHSLFPK